jgi:hypothetical protein
VKIGAGMRAGVLGLMQKGWIDRRLAEFGGGI